MEIKKFGTLLFNNVPHDPGANYNGDAIRIGDTIPGKEIPWAVFGENYIAAQSVCFNVSYAALNSAGLIGGNPVKIDSEYYLCRAPRVGTSEKGKSEWNQFYNSLTASDAEMIKNLHDPGFWGAETLGGIYHASRWFSENKQIWTLNFMADGNCELSYRPVLAPLAHPPAIDRDMLGKRLRVFLPTGAIAATLIDFSDYDLFFDCKNKSFDKRLDMASWGMIDSDCNLVVDRNEAIYYSVIDGI